MRLHIDFEKNNGHRGSVSIACTDRADGERWFRDHFQFVMVRASWMTKDDGTAPQEGR